MTTKPTLGSSKAFGATLGSADWNLNVLQQGNWVQEVLAGTNTDKIPQAALTFGAGALGGVAGNQVAGPIFGGTSPNYDTLRMILRRATSVNAWQNAAWRLVRDIDNGGAQPSMIDFGDSFLSVIVNGNTYKFDANGKLSLSAVVGPKLDLYNDGNGFYALGVEAGGTYLKANGKVALYTTGSDTPGSSTPGLAVDSAGKFTGKGIYRSGIVSLSTGTTTTFTHGLGAQPSFVWGYTGNSNIAVQLPITTFGKASGGTPTEVYFSTCDATSITVGNLTGITMYVQVQAML